MSDLALRQALIEKAKATDALVRLKTREAHAKSHGGLIAFVRTFWHILEPNRKFVEGWAVESVCAHLEAVSRGEITRILINVPPGFMKSMLCNIFFPAWEWAAQDKAWKRYLAFSYGSYLTERDNSKLLTLLKSHEFQRLYGDKFKLTEEGKIKISNDKMGWKFASSVGGTSTGERGDVVLLDDPHNVKDQESDTIRNKTVTWFQEAMENRLNSLTESAIIVIMQRVHEFDISGAIITDKFAGYTHLCIPMEYEEGRDVHKGKKIATSIGWTDPRWDDGELAWPERFPSEGLTKFKARAYMWAGQYQQRPEPRGGGLIKRAWWNMWENEKFPATEFRVASLDSAYTVNERNDPSGMTVWGTFELDGRPKVVLMNAWRKWLDLHGQATERQDHETRQQWKNRTHDKWGLVEWVADTCERLKVHVLLIEGKASGLSVAQEIARLYRDKTWSVEIIDPKGEKYARLFGVSHLFSEGLIYRPDRDWAELVEDEMAVFPGTFRDLGDSGSQALKYLRDRGLVVRREERAQMERELLEYRREEGPVYTPF